MIARSAAAGSGGWIDVSRPVADGTAVWPGDPPWRYRLAASIAGGDLANVGEVSGTTHTGTHVDAPLHVDPDGAAIDGLPLEIFAGPSVLLDVSADGDRIESGEIEAALRAFEAAIGGTRAPDRTVEGDDPIERLLLRTGCDWSAGFPTRWRALSAEAAKWCGARGLRLVGTDAPSVDPEASTALDAHRALAASGVVILEGLMLAGIEPGRYALVAFPLRWIGADASPVRAALRRMKP
ncbi:MAG TPA: cyclase family protein [Gemmatimonadota bacterium]|nr:cyclase family protein [Gemmatimonadota bacterium]